MLAQLVQPCACFLQVVWVIVVSAHNGVGESAALDSAVGKVSAQHGVGLPAHDGVGLPAALENAVGNPGSDMVIEGTGYS